MKFDFDKGIISTDRINNFINRLHKDNFHDTLVRNLIYDVRKGEDCVDRFGEDEGRYFSFEKYTPSAAAQDMYRKIKTTLVDSLEARLSKIGGICAIILIIVIATRIGWACTNKILFIFKLKDLDLLTLQNIRKNSQEINMIKQDKKINEIIREIEKIQQHIISKTADLEIVTRRLSLGNN